MRSRIAKLGCAAAVLLAGGYALVTLRSGIPQLIQKQKEIRALEKENTGLEREIQFRRDHIQRLQQDQSEQEFEIKRRLKLVKPGEKVFILQEPVAQKTAAKP